MPHRSMPLPSLRPRLVGLALTGLALGLSLPAAGQVVLSGILGGRALLLVGASAPKAVAPGETFQGVRLVSLDKDSALLEQDGQRFTLRLGDSPVQVKPGSGVARPANGKRITLTSDSAGHFKSQGSINGQIIQLHSVRIGDVEVFDVDAVVTPQPMPVVLLGNSFLDRFQMHRVSDQMVLEKRL